jgi:hypothetical protein
MDEASLPISVMEKSLCLMQIQPVSANPAAGLTE